MENISLCFVTNFPKGDSGSAPSSSGKADPFKEAEKLTAMGRRSVQSLVTPGVSGPMSSRWRRGRMHTRKWVRASRLAWGPWQQRLLQPRGYRVGGLPGKSFI